MPLDVRVLGIGVTQ